MRERHFACRARGLHGEVESRVHLVSLVLQRFICTGARTDGRRLGSWLALAWPLVPRGARCDVHAVVLRLPFVHDSCPC